MEKLSYEYAEKVICVSEDTQNRLVERYNIGVDKTLFIPNGIDLDYRKRDKSIYKQRKSLLYVGRLDKRKGIHEIVQMMPDLIKLDPDITLRIVGKGPLYQKLQTFIEEHELHKNVSLLGFLSEDRKKEIMNKSEILLVPSVFEGFGIVVLEGVACGCIVIGNKTDGLNMFRSFNSVKLLQTISKQSLLVLLFSIFNEDGSVLDDDNLYKYDMKYIIHQYTALYAIYKHE